MDFNPEPHHRRSIRLRDYDYSCPGGYFITVCTKNREPILGEVHDGKMVLNALGKIVKQTWLDLPNHIANIQLDAFVVLPNHMHGIVLIVEPDPFVGAGSEPAPTTTRINKVHGLPEIVRQFKTFSSRRINQCRHLSGVAVWQRNYYEHVIRHETELKEIRQYIIDNPQKWDEDRYFEGDSP